MKSSSANSKNIVEKMTSEPVSRLIVTLAIPTILSMMVTAIYSMADTFFVSKLGTSASGAVGVIFSLQAIVQAVGFTIGMGSGAIVSRALGAKNQEKADRYCSSAFFFILSAGILLALFGFFFKDWIIVRLGATPTILPFARSYMSWILLGIPFMASTFTLNNQLRFQGRANLAVVGLATGGILNIFLDPLFIFVFNFGISGAAIATSLSQLTSFSILLSMFLRKKTAARISPACISKSPRTYAAILKNGFPSFCRQGLASLSTIMLNVAAGAYGDAAVAGMSITGRAFHFLMAISIGIGQGFQPVCAMNYGARLGKRVKEAFFFMIKFSAAVMMTLGVFVFIFAPEIIRLFRDDDMVVLVGAAAMRFQCLTLPFHSIMHGVNMTLQSSGQAKSATFLSSLRQGIYFIPMILIFPHFWGLPGVEVTQTAADILTSLTSIPFAVAFFKKLPIIDGKA